jgi:hypothetical protein
MKTQRALSLNRLHKQFLLLILLPFLLPLKAYTQLRETVHPFIGVNGNFLGISNAGWGVEAGLKYDWFYVSAEYGNYGKISPEHPLSFGFTPAEDSAELAYEASDPHLNISREHFFCLSTGFIILHSLWIGIELLYSEQSYTHPHRVQGATDVLYMWENRSNTWFDAGFDIRVEGWNHLLLDLAYSHRRGLKSGLGYVF